MPLSLSDFSQAKHETVQLTKTYIAEAPQGVMEDGNCRELRVVLTGRDTT